MLRLMADNNVEGHLNAIIRFLRSGLWEEFWEKAAVTLVTLRELGLERNSPDLTIWQVCQSRQVVLFTANRNKEGPESLEEAIRTLNRPDSLPVITIGDLSRFKHDRPYAEQARSEERRV